MYQSLPKNALVSLKCEWKSGNSLRGAFFCNVTRVSCFINFATQYNFMQINFKKKNNFMVKNTILYFDLSKFIQ